LTDAARLLFEQAGGTFVFVHFWPLPYFSTALGSLTPQIGPEAVSRGGHRALSSATGRPLHRSTARPPPLPRPPPQSAIWLILDNLHWNVGYFGQ